MRALILIFDAHPPPWKSAQIQMRARSFFMIAHRAAASRHPSLPYPLSRSGLCSTFRLLIGSPASDPASADARRDK